MFFLETQNRKTVCAKIITCLFPLPKKREQNGGGQKEDVTYMVRKYRLDATPPLTTSVSIAAVFSSFSSLPSSSALSDE